MIPRRTVIGILWSPLPGGSWRQGFHRSDAVSEELRCPPQSGAFGVHRSEAEHECRRLWTGENLAALRGERTDAKAVLMPQRASE